MKKKIISLSFVVIVCLMFFSLIAFSSELKIQLTNIKLFLNGNRVDKEIYIVGESSYLPIRAISEALDLEVKWDDENRAIYLLQKSTKSGDDIILEEFGIYENIEQENKALKERIRKLEKENLGLKEKLSHNKNTTNNSKQENSDLDNQSSASSTISGEVVGNKILLNWTPIYADKFQGYKVVISKNNSSPKYPDDGYMLWITDKNKTSAYIDSNMAYNNGDIGKYLTPGQKYYFSVTAVYDNGKVPGNVISLEYPNN